MKSTRATTKRGAGKGAARSKEYAITLSHLKKKFKVNQRGLIRQVGKILRNEKKKGQVEVILAGDALLKRLNREFTGKNKTTDVLSFPWQESLTPKKRLNYLGEIYISLEQAQRQAKEYGVTGQEELLRLVTHGTLHLLGYDHQKKDEARIMRKKEEKYLHGR
jgi:probable rRNA maturation factor